jgi:archaellum component FlaC
MTDVLEVFEEVHRSGKNEMPEKLAECVRLETRILAQLTGIPMGLENEQQHQDKTDLFAALQKIITAQRTNLKDSKEAQTGTMSAQVTALLAANQDRVANDIVGFTDLCLVMVEGRVDDDFATQIRKVYDLVENGSVYEKALGAAESLEEGDFAAGIQYQEEVLKTLMQALNVLNQWRMRNAQKIVKEATEVLKKTAEKLDELEAKQARIAEVTRDLTTRGKIDDEVREKLAEMDEEQKDMANLVEELANDLYQFPELPVCNELNSKMREIFEDVEQAMESENAPAIEIAVQKEDSLLDAIRKTKERIEDVEMWLPDIPDNIVWNMESFDTDEFPDMPLVPLPDELEDIVGDLLDQASDIDAQSQDSTGNNMIADMEMGWGVMDGPMPCFSAKGKSGNTRPNDNEMTGRSGAGREGQSNGELVENHVKGLEGRKTHARRTQDPFQNGMVTEDEDSTMDARSTGGGKLGGESESIGMFGKAPRRDLHTPDHGTGPTQLRQETEALYATARLLYLGTGSLGTAARELRGVESAAKKMRDFGSLHRRVLRRLEDTQVELNSGVVLPMPVTSVSKTGGAATDDVDVSKISEEYRDIVSDYYRSLETE